MATKGNALSAGKRRTVAELEAELAQAEAERDAALAHAAATAGALAQRNSEYSERIEQQAATIDVLKVMSASPADPQPVFDLIAVRARDLCDAYGVSVLEFDGTLIHHRASTGISDDPVRREAVIASFPTTPAARPMVGRAILERRIIRIDDIDAVYDRNQIALADVKSLVIVPMLRGESVIGALSMGGLETGGFSDTQVELLKTFAEQAVIAITSAEAHREQREALEQQTATAEVLGVINASPGDLAPVFGAILEKAHRFCGAVDGTLFLFDGERMRAAAIRGGVPEAFAERLRQGVVAAEMAVTAALLAGEAFVHIPDLALVDDPMARAGVEISKTRTLLAVPLRRGDALLGMIVGARKEVSPFAPKEIALLRTFAAQAVIAMENARLITETREALEQQTATAEVLQVINSSPGDLGPVFDAMLEKALRLCDAAYGVLLAYDGEGFSAAALRDVPPSFADFLSATRIVPSSGSRAGFGQLVAGSDFVHFLDVAGQDGYSNPGTGGWALVELGGARTIMLAALRKEGVLFGAITAYRKEVRAFSEKQIAIFRNFAAQAVIAMENARLITETREALEQQTATAEVLQVINSSPGDLGPVFDAMLEKALRLSGGAFGNLLSYDGELFNVEAAVHHDGRIGEELRRRAPFRAIPGGTLSAMLDGQVVSFTANILETPDYLAGHAEFRRMVDGGGYRSVLNVALRKESALFGTIGIFRTEVRPFTDKEIALLQNFAAQAVVAMENARLLGELRQRTEEVAELNRGLEARVAEQVEELGRVGRLKRFLAPQLAELIVSQGDENILESHRREIVVVFCDLRGYTAFTETAEPEEVLDFLREYHGALGPLVAQFEGTLDQFSGDGIMVFFNDPVPIPDPAERAVKMAMAMREAAASLIADWRERGRDLGFGAGIAQGYATLGQIGFSERSGYTAIGTVCNVAARLCAEAKDGQILLSQRVNAALKGSVTTEQLGALTLKGLTQPIAAYNVPLATNHPALRVIEGGPESV